MKLAHIRPGQWLIIKGIALILFLKTIYILIIAKYTNVDDWLTRAVGSSTAKLCSWLGRESRFEEGFLILSGIRSVYIGNACNGLELYALFSGFLLITPGKLLSKALYVLLGSGLIFLINTARVYLLGINFIHNPSTFEFNHKYTYLGLVYLAVFVLWMVWVELISKKELVREIE